MYSHSGRASTAPAAYEAKIDTGSNIHLSLLYFPKRSFDPYVEMHLPTIITAPNLPTPPVSVYCHCSLTLRKDEYTPTSLLSRPTQKRVTDRETKRQPTGSFATKKA